MTSDKSMLAELDDGAPVPRSNGELVFQEPWESRAFGLALGLCEQGVIEWGSFRSQLISEISSWEKEPAGEWSYYTRWLSALEKELARLQLLDPVDVDRMTSEIVATEFAHDDHDHDHDHH
jgi:nitrile hydratase accessory protein